MERINQTADGAERKAALCMLLDQETQLISAIGRHKIEADTENKDKRIQQFLSKVSYYISLLNLPLRSMQTLYNSITYKKVQNLNVEILYITQNAILMYKNKCRRQEQ